jgi:hypothetical protein
MYRKGKYNCYGGEQSAVIIYLLIPFCPIKRLAASSLVHIGGIVIARAKIFTKAAIFHLFIDKEKFTSVMAPAHETQKILMP